MPKTIGVVGCGTIGSGVVRGLLSGPALPSTPIFVLSPQGSKVAALLKEFPDSVTIATDDQAVLDAVDCLVIGLPGSVAITVLSSLKFRAGQKVISLVSAVKLAPLQSLVGAAVDCTIAVPLPAIATRQGATLGFPDKEYSRAIFSATGTYTAVASEGQLTYMKSAAAFMGDFYKRQLTIQQWLTEHGTPADTAAAYLGAVFATFAADSAHATATTFAEKVAEQTPGGLNEMVWKQQQAAGVYEAINKSLDAVYKRNNNASQYP